MEWSNSRELLAVAGTSQQTTQYGDAQSTTTYKNILNFYTESGMLLYTTQIPNTTTTVSALTWGHNDKRLFIATGTQVSYLPAGIINIDCTINESPFSNYLGAHCLGLKKSCILTAVVSTTNPELYWH